MEKRKSPPPIREVRQPSFRPPAGSCDCHVHIIGPQSIYPLAPQTAVVMEDSTLEDFQNVQATLGIHRALIVASGGDAFSYQHVLNILYREPEMYRGVVFLPPDITEKELAVLDDAGVVGARFYPAVNTPDARTLARVHELGWSAHFLISNTDHFNALLPSIEFFGGHSVLEHSGRPDPAAGLQSDHFKKILQLLDTDRCWIKLSPRFSKMPVPPFEDTLPFIHAMIEHRPDRMLYGSDYPHPQYFNPMPNEADFLELMLLWAPQEQVRELIFARNPEALFGFPKLT